MRIMEFTRRQFIKAGMIVTGGLLMGLKATNKAYAAVKSQLEYIKDRLKGIYKHDREMEIRTSQDNPMIQYAYKKFFGHPMSDLSEKLLHTEYQDRSAIVKKLEQEGIFSRRAFNSLKIGYPFEG